MKISFKALVLFTMSIFLYGAASNTQSGWQYIISSLLFSLLIIGFILPLKKIKNIDLNKYIPSRLFVGKDVTVEITINNLSNKDKKNINISDKPIVKRIIEKNINKSNNIVKDMLEIIYEILFNKDMYKIYYEYFVYRDYSVEYFVRKLEKYQSVVYKTSFIPIKRGVYNLGNVIIYDSSPFGLFTFQKVFKNEEEIVVYPKILSVRGGWVNRIAHKSVVQELAYSYIPTSLPGTTRNLREYVPGDSPRHIHWPTSAKTDRLMIREFEIEASGYIVMVLDSSYDYKDDNYYELAVITTASLLNACHNRLIKTRFITQYDSYKYPVNGNDDDWEYQLELLARVKSVSSTPAINLIDKVHKGIVIQNPRSKPTYVLISPKYRTYQSDYKDDIVSIVVSPEINKLAHYNITTEDDLKYI